ncbi:MAG: glutamine synthetase, partial [Minwuiales bacterium]|nr:glutamine synthetase [Minwuiales bacterium]
ILAGLHHGITNQIEPPEPMTGNAYDQLEPSLPTRWPDALDLFDRSAVLRDYLGDRFCGLFATCKRGELAKFEAHISDLEHAWYL